MDYVWATALVLINLVWLVSVVAGMPGTWLMVICTCLLAWRRQGDGAGNGADMFSLTPLITIGLLAVAAEIAEFFTGVVGSKKAGGTKRGAIGALVGGLIGGFAATFLIPIPVLGTLIGACAGAALGALIGEFTGGRSLGASAKSGAGAGVGTLAGRLLKVVFGALIWLIAAVAAFWP